MDSYTIYYLLETIAGNPKKTVKIAFLEELLEDEDFKKVIQLAYNPLITFGILTVPETLSTGDDNFDHTTFEMLSALAERKLTGNAAKSFILEELNRLNIESGTLLTRILKKDLRAGFTAKSINKAMPGTIPSFPYMRCSTVKQVPLNTLDWRIGAFSQVKADGMFVNISVKNASDVLITSRQGQAFPKDLVDLGYCLYPGYQYHGEALVIDKITGVTLPRKDGNGILNSIRQGSELDSELRLHFVLWDMVALSDIEKGEGDQPYEERLAGLRTILKNNPKEVSICETRKVGSLEEANRHYYECIKKGKEGTILKMADALWKDGDSRRQIKLKPDKECEMIVKGILPGKGKYIDTTGRILVESSDGKVKTYLSGFTDKERDDIWNNPEEWLDKIVTVRFNETIYSNSKGCLSLFLPRFVERRSDKDSADDISYIRGL